MRIVIGLLLALLLSACGSSPEMGIGLAGQVSLADNWNSPSLGEFTVFQATTNYQVVFKDRSLPRLNLSTGINSSFTMSGSSRNMVTGEVIDYRISGRYTNTSMSGTLVKTYKRFGMNQSLASFSSNFSALKQRHETGTRE